MTGPTTPTADVESVIQQFFRAMDTQDMALMERIVAHDADLVHIGTDDGEIWRGGEDLWTATETQFENLEYYKASIRDLTVNLARSGAVAWYFHLLDARIKSAGKAEVRWDGARFTGVVERRNGRWVMVQTHVSLPESA